MRNKALLIVISVLIIAASVCLSAYWLWNSEGLGNLAPKSTAEKTNAVGTSTNEPFIKECTYLQDGFPVLAQCSVLIIANNDGLLKSKNALTDQIAQLVKRYNGSIEENPGIYMNILLADDSRIYELKKDLESIEQIDGVYFNMLTQLDDSNNQQ